MSESVRENRAGGTRRDSPAHSFVQYRKREGMVTIRLLMSEAEELSQVLGAITRSHIPNPERWGLIANIAHDLDRKLDQLRKDPK